MSVSSFSLEEEGGKMTSSTGVRGVLSFLMSSLDGVDDGGGGDG